jgi:hypothetical protein
VPIIPISGVMKAATKALTSSLKEPPMTIATARSTTLPRRMKSRKPVRGEWRRSQLTAARAAE